MTTADRAVIRIWESDRVFNSPMQRSAYVEAST